MVGGKGLTEGELVETYCVIKEKDLTKKKVEIRKSWIPRYGSRMISELLSTDYTFMKMLVI